MFTVELVVGVRKANIWSVSIHFFLSLCFKIGCIKVYFQLCNLAQ